NYHDANGALPAGVNRYHRGLGLNLPPNGYHAWWSWMAEALAYIEQSSAYKTADTWARQNNTPGAPLYWWPWGDVGNSSGIPGNPILGQFQTMYACPSDPRQPVINDFNVTGVN